MFIGHYAVGLASKRVAPKASLGILIAAPQVLDMLWPIFLLLGWEHVQIHPGDTKFTPFEFVSYPYSHSLVMSILWGVILAAVYWMRKRDGRASVVILLSVVSHWVLDFVTHRPDMPIAPWSDVKVGLGLWNSVAATIIIEGLLFTAGVWIYWKFTQSLDRIGSVGFWAFVIFLVVSYVASILGPPPPNTTAVAWGSLSIWIFPFWAGWFDRHRKVRETN
ncbi:MAG TPA: metal-dependent hydrolase [Acidobacteriota bacterium]|nr:metal-dependent hydrolase [Acidobacteriota bacterium]